MARTTTQIYPRNTRDCIRRLLNAFIALLNPPTAQKGKKYRSEAERLDYFCRSPFISDFGQHWTTCALCNETLRLDPRGLYYPLMVDKHTRLCFEKHSRKAEDLMKTYLGSGFHAFTVKVFYPKPEDAPKLTRTPASQRRPTKSVASRARSPEVNVSDSTSGNGKMPEDASKSEDAPKPETLPASKSQPTTKSSQDGKLRAIVSDSTCRDCKMPEGSVPKPKTLPPSAKRHMATDGPESSVPARHRKLLANVSDSNLLRSRTHSSLHASQL